MEDPAGHGVMVGTLVLIFATGLASDVLPEEGGVFKKGFLGKLDP